MTVSTPDFSDLDQNIRCTKADELPIPNDSFWVFGYGSLMWNPGFRFKECHRATLYGYHRRLCLWSTRYRGDKANPGLVLGLDRGGSCQGFAFLVAKSQASTTSSYLYQREMVNNAYSAEIKSLHLADGRCIPSLTFISKPDHPQFAKRQTIEDMAWIVYHAKGQRGENREYVVNCADKLTELGIHNTQLHKVVRALNKLSELSDSPA